MNQENLNKLIAGTVAGTNEAIITWPTENIKTQMQFKNENKSFREMSKKIYKTSGLSGFYKGISPILCFNIPKVASRFFAFEEAKKHINFQNKHINTISAGLFAGFIESTLVTVPSETMKTKLIRNPNLSVWKIARTNGLTSLYQGYFPTLYRQSLNQASRFLFYENYKELLKKQNISFTNLHSFLGGVGAGAFSVLVSTPFDIIKTQMQEGKKDKMINVGKYVYQQYGIRGFWRGSFARLLRVGPGQGVMFLSYEFVSKYLNKKS